LDLHGAPELRRLGQLALADALRVRLEHAHQPCPDSACRPAGRERGSGPPHAARPRSSRSSGQRDNGSAAAAGSASGSPSRGRRGPLAA
jgi:hypothetical protein